MNQLLKNFLTVSMFSGIYLYSATAEASDSAYSIDCNYSQDGKNMSVVEKTICGDKELKKLDQKLSSVYAKALRYDSKQSTQLRANQRGWIKGRDDCWKNTDVRQCVATSYKMRIAELQALYDMAPKEGPFTYSCDDNPGLKVSVTFFQTDPKILIAELGEEVALMYLNNVEGIKKYIGQNETLTEQGLYTYIEWGSYQDAKKLQCTKQTNRYRDNADTDGIPDTW